MIKVKKNYFSSKESNLTSQIEWINFLHNVSHKLLWDCLEIHGQISDEEYCGIFHCKQTKQ